MKSNTPRLADATIRSSAGMTAVLLAAGIMDLRVTAAVTAAITIECLAPAAELVAHAIEAVVIAVELFLAVRAV